jgi:hypothetical protein
VETNQIYPLEGDKNHESRSGVEETAQKFIFTAAKMATHENKNV